MEEPRSESTPKTTTKIAPKNNKQPAANSIQARVGKLVAQRPKPASEGSKLTSVEAQKQIASLSADQARTLLIAL